MEGIRRDFENIERLRRLRLKMVELNRRHGFFRQLLVQSESLELFEKLQIPQVFRGILESGAQINQLIQQAIAPSRLAPGNRMIQNVADNLLLFVVAKELDLEGQFTYEDLVNKCLLRFEQEKNLLDVKTVYFLVISDISQLNLIDQEIAKQGYVQEEIRAQIQNLKVFKRNFKLYSEIFSIDLEMREKRHKYIQLPRFSVFEKVLRSSYKFLYLAEPPAGRSWERRREKLQADLDEHLEKMLLLEGFLFYPIVNFFQVLFLNIKLVLAKISKGFAISDFLHLLDMVGSYFLVLRQSEVLVVKDRSNRIVFVEQRLQERDSLRLVQRSTLLNSQYPEHLGYRFASTSTPEIGCPELVGKDGPLHLRLEGIFLDSARIEVRDIRTREVLYCSPALPDVTGTQRIEDLPYAEGVVAAEITVSLEFPEGLHRACEKKVVHLKSFYENIVPLQLDDVSLAPGEQLLLEVCGENLGDFDLLLFRLEAEYRRERLLLGQAQNPVSLE